MPVVASFLSLSRVTCCFVLRLFYVYGKKKEKKKRIAVYLAGPVINRSVKRGFGENCKMGGGEKKKNSNLNDQLRLLRVETMSVDSNNFEFGFQKKAGNTGTENGHRAN